MSTSKHTNSRGLSSGDSHNKGSVSPPTDMELMLYFDGELSKARTADVETHIAQDISAKKKLYGLRLASGIVRGQSAALEMRADIVAAVMSAIDAGIDKQSRNERVGGNPIGLLPVRRGMPHRSTSRPANDNSRSIFMLAAIAVAAAAVMMIWGRAGVDAPPSASVKGDTPSVTREVAPTPAQLPPKAVEAAPAADTDSEQGVEVAAVDFGAHTGSIFYVPSGAAASNAVTTVVWVDDEVVGGK